LRALLALVEDRDDGIDLGHGLIARDMGRQRLHQGLPQVGGVAVRGQQIGQRREMRDDLVGLLLDLPHALEIAERTGVILDPCPEQRGDGGLQERRQALQGLDLDDAPGFDPVDRRPRDPEALGDVLGLQPAAQAVGFQPLTDFLEPDCHRADPICRIDLNLRF
jgi:hypothetical protein